MIQIKSRPEMIAEGDVTVVHGANDPGSSDSETYSNAVLLQFNSHAEMQRAVQEIQRHNREINNV